MTANSRRLLLTLCMVCKTIYLFSRKVAPTVITEMYSASFFMKIKMLLSSKKFSGNWQRKYCPRKSCIIWKLNEEWPLKKDSISFLPLLKLFKFKKNSITALRLLKFLIMKKGLRLITFLRLFRLLMLNNDSITFLRLLKFLKPKRDSTTFLCLLKFLVLGGLILVLMSHVCYLAVILIFLVVTWWLLLVTTFSMNGSS